MNRGEIGINQITRQEKIDDLNRLHCENSAVAACSIQWLLQTSLSWFSSFLYVLN